MGVGKEIAPLHLAERSQNDLKLGVSENTGHCKHPGGLLVAGRGGNTIDDIVDPIRCAKIPCPQTGCNRISSDRPSGPIDRKVGPAYRNRRIATRPAAEEITHA